MLDPTGSAAAASRASTRPSTAGQSIAHAEPVRQSLLPAAATANGRCETDAVATLDGTALDPAHLGALALVNYGHFTSMRVEDRGVRGLSLHLDRLVRDCRRLFGAELDRERVRRCVRDTVADLGRPVLVRVTVFDPALDLADLAADAAPRVLVTTRPVREVMTPLRLSSAVYQRDLPEVKHVGLFGAMHRLRAARRRGVDDVLFTDAHGVVCETSIANIGFLDGARVVWPRAEWLPGVTMRLISEFAETATQRVATDQLHELDAAFVVNAAVGVRPVGSVDHASWRQVSAVVERLRRHYTDLPLEPL